MKTTEAKTPAQVGLSLAVLSGPRGHFADDWRAIEYTCELSNARRQVIWTGSYKLGIGHVKWPRKFEEYPHGLTTEQTYGLNTIRMNPGTKLKDRQAHADLAAILAKAQKVTPKLEDVCHSLLMDGAAFFDGQRFEDWAADYGSNPDSIKAKETFDACDRIGRDLARGLSRDELDALREWASNY